MDARLIRAVGALGVVFAASTLAAQTGGQTAAHATTRPSDVRGAAAADTELRIVVSRSARRLFVVARAHDTLLDAPVAVGSSRTLRYASEHWTFTTPAGVRTVIGKERDPVWIPPDWHYVEVARSHHLSLVWLRRDTIIALRDNQVLYVQPESIYLDGDSSVTEFGPATHVVVGHTLYVPPVGYINRRVPGELGKFRLDLGGGVGIHGTPETASIGRAVTHGCMRLGDADIEWLYDHVPVGTRVYIY